MKEELVGTEEDLEFGSEDVVIEKEGQILSISFSQKVHAQLERPWKNAVIVKLLGRTMGYRALCNRLESLWGMSKDSL